MLSKKIKRKKDQRNTSLLNSYRYWKTYCSAVTVNTLKWKINIMKHLKENNTTYAAHWWRAMSMSVTLFIHAWIPSLFPTYASDKMKSDS